MLIDVTNRIVQLCVAGIHVEGEPERADELFRLAWQEASTDLEKCIAAHYVARRQLSVDDKLEWDTIALQAALQVEKQAIENFLPSLYLNVAKGYEDKREPDKALAYYQLATESASHLPNDGYNHMIRTGIQNGLARLSP